MDRSNRRKRVNGNLEIALVSRSFEARDLSPEPEDD